MPKTRYQLTFLAWFFWFINTSICRKFALIKIKHKDKSSGVGVFPFSTFTHWYFFYGEKSQITNQWRLVEKYKMERGSNGSASWRTRIKTIYDTRNPRKSALLASVLSAFKSLIKRH
jgi:hypothetical protein